MGFSLLLDEMTEASLAEYCRKLGHDVERVVTVSELGSGSDDGEIVAECPTVLGETRFGHLVEQQRKAHLQVLGSCDRPTLA